MKVKDIKLKKCFKLSNTTAYDIWFDLVDANAMLNGQKSKGRMDWTFDEVTYIRKYINDFTLDNLQQIYDICFLPKKLLKFVPTKTKLQNLYLFEMIAWYKYISNEIKEINEYESSISNEPSIELIQAGIDRMKRFEYLNTKIPLAEKFGKSPQEIGQWKWIDVFLYSSYTATFTDIQNKHSKILANKK